MSIVYAHDVECMLFDRNRTDQVVVGESSKFENRSKDVVKASDSIFFRHCARYKFDYYHYY